MGREVTFSEAWSQGKARLLRSIGISFLGTPLLLTQVLLLWMMTNQAPTSPLLWLLSVVMTLFLSSFFAFSFCAVMIDNVKVLRGAWISVLITVQNFFRTSVITGTVYVVGLLITGLTGAILSLGLFGIVPPFPLSFDYPTYQKVLAIPIVSWTNWVFNLVLFPLESVMLTFAYLQFTKEVPYLALFERQSTA